MASGKTYREIAEYLALSPHTVRRHMEHIYKKLGVQSKTQAVNAGRERNFFENV
ncbi:MAG: helix-turn-helix transcriptional regulator [Spirochaetes bacterium]|nr:helix-turn-helix transcriptional regulator [Spirochaetota bacterium]MBX3723602.1 helix-turn-helix transcriptional regulator [Turneriella sp.]